MKMRIIYTAPTNLGRGLRLQNMPRRSPAIKVGQAEHYLEKLCRVRGVVVRGFVWA